MDRPGRLLLDVPLGLAVGFGSLTAAEVSRWAALHPSRFARQYHQRFGELPSQTLRGT